MAPIATSSAFVVGVPSASVYSVRKFEGVHYLQIELARAPFAPHDTVVLGVLKPVGAHAAVCLDSFLSRRHVGVVATPLSRKRVRFIKRMPLSPFFSVRASMANMRPFVMFFAKSSDNVISLYLRMI